MFGAILKTTNTSFQKGMTFCRSIYVKKIMKLLAFIFEQSSYFRGSVSVFLRVTLLKVDKKALYYRFAGLEQSLKMSSQILSV